MVSSQWEAPTHLLPIDGGDKPGKSESEKNPDGICCHHVPNRTVRLRVADGCDLVSIVKNKIRGGFEIHHFDDSKDEK